MLSTMQDFPLNIGMIYRHGRTVHRNSQVVTFHPDGSRRASFAEVADRAELLAAALHRLGIVPGDRVGTFIWNVQEHIEAYFAIPCMGAVCHTLNLRLFPEQLTYIVNHAADRAIIVGADLVPLLAAVAGDLKTVEYYIVVGEGDVSPLVEAAPAAQVLDYEELLAAESLGFDWPDVDEREAAAMCYTSGTTGHPKGVVYSHRSTVLHSITAHGPSGLLFTPRDVVLPIVPMFHANAWGIPYAIWMVGADLVLPGKYLQGEFVARMVEEEQATWSGGVPTIWTDVLQYAATHDVDLSSLRGVLSGGSAVPRVLIERMWNELGVAVLQGWGMTETSPLAAIGWPPAAPRPVARKTSTGACCRVASSPGWSYGSSTRRAPSCRGTASRSARSRRGAPGSPRRTTRTPPPIGSTTAGSAPATSRASARMASSRSAIARRTSSSRVASGSRRSSSRGS